MEGLQAVTDLPRTALSLQQPWAWAVVEGVKDVENRSAASVRLGNMHPGRIAIHSSKIMTRSDYTEAKAFMKEIGVECPPPDMLPRGCMVGAVTVEKIVRGYASPWYRGPVGLVLRDAMKLDAPIAARGALGYFSWSPCDPSYMPGVLPWMKPPEPKAKKAKPPLAPSTRVDHLWAAFYMLSSPGGREQFWKRITEDYGPGFAASLREQFELFEQQHPRVADTLNKKRVRA